MKAVIKGGDKVRYHPIIGDPKDDGKIYSVFGTQYLGKRRVAFLNGKVGCVAIESLTRVKL